jgi:hypothetical protein
MWRPFTRPGPSLPAVAGGDRGGLPETDCLRRAKIGFHQDTGPSEHGSVPEIVLGSTRGCEVSTTTAEKLVRTVAKLPQRHSFRRIYG